MSDPQVSPKVNKSQFVKNILSQIGALSKNPPENWRSQVEEALEKNNLKVHRVTIYQIRSKAMQGMKRKNPIVVAKTNVRRASIIAPASLKVADLYAIKDFAKQFGGVDRLKEAIKALEAFIN
jgi:hypothetical protein